MRLIDADSAKRTYTKDMFDTEEDFERVNDVLDYAPTVDAVSVVRCKDCKHWQRHTGVVDSPNGHYFALEICTNGMDFCSYGERKEQTHGES